jgi:hypothetical protein
VTRRDSRLTEAQPSVWIQVNQGGALRVLPSTSTSISRLITVREPCRGIGADCLPLAYRRRSLPVRTSSSCPKAWQVRLRSASRSQRRSEATPGRSSPAAVGVRAVPRRSDPDDVTCVDVYLPGVFWVLLPLSRPRPQPHPEGGWSRGQGSTRPRWLGSGARLKVDQLAVGPRDFASEGVYEPPVLDRTLETVIARYGAPADTRGAGAH